MGGSQAAVTLRTHPSLGGDPGKALSLDLLSPPLALYSLTTLGKGLVNSAVFLRVLTLTRLLASFLLPPFRECFRSEHITTQQRGMS